jgi:hypothetical protein
VDPVLAVTRGGEHVLANFGTACWKCNLRKSNDTGFVPPVAPREDGTWDGMLAVFKGITQDTTDSAERTWRRAIDTPGL